MSGTMVLTLAGAQPIFAISEKLITATPQDVVAALYLQPSAPPTSEGTPAEMLAILAGRLREMGLFGRLSGERGKLFDLLECWPVVHRYPRAYVLRDLSFESSSKGSNRLNGLSMSLILQVGQDNADVQKLIQRFLNKYTNDETGHLEEKTIRGVTIHRLTDSSWPKWAIWEWGQIDDLFIVSIGPGMSARVLQALTDSGQSLLKNKWFARGHAKTRGNSAEIELYVNVARLNSCLGEGARDRVTDVIDSLDIKSSEKWIWTIGSQAKAVTCFAYHRQTDGGDVLENISDPSLYQPEHMKLIPQAATRYAIIHRDAATVWRKIRGCYLAAHRIEKRYELLKAWSKLAETQGVDVEREVLSQLGERIIIHNYPEHPLHLPLAWTILVEIKGDAHRVRSALDKIFNYTALRLDVAADRDDARMVSLTMRRSHDRVWYTQYGFYGPALAVTEGWLAISFSPQALRANFAPSVARRPNAPSSNASDTKPLQSRDAGHQTEAQANEHDSGQ